MNDTYKRSRDHYEKYFKPTGEVRVPKYGEFYLDLDQYAIYDVIFQYPKEPYSGMFEPKNPYVIMEEVEDVLEPPKEEVEIVFCLEDGSVYMGEYLKGQYREEINSNTVTDVIAWKYTSEIFEEMTIDK